MTPEFSKKDVTLAHNRKTRRWARLKGFGTNKPTDLGIKAYKKLHPDEPKRVVYYKTEMHKALKEMR